MGMKRRANYPVTHTQITPFTTSSGAQQVTIDNAFLGSIPESILIVVIYAAFVGSANTNPFHFHYYDMTSCAASKWNSSPF
jgi:hypothetical protein